MLPLAAAANASEEDGQGDGADIGHHYPEFPPDAEPIMKAVLALYANRQEEPVEAVDGAAAAAAVVDADASSSSSASNSDSGIGFKDLASDNRLAREMEDLRFEAAAAAAGPPVIEADEDDDGEAGAVLAGE